MPKSQVTSETGLLVLSFFLPGLEMVICNRQTRLDLDTQLYYVRCINYVTLCLRSSIVLDVGEEYCAMSTLDRSMSMMGWPL